MHFGYNCNLLAFGLILAMQLLVQAFASTFRPRTRMTKHEARKLLRENGLRATAPRMAVLALLAKADTPLSHSEVRERLGETDWDQATIYRNLVKLRDAGIAPVVICVDGIDRYEMDGARGGGRAHPHFVCEDCGKVACLPAELTESMSMPGPWAASIEKAMVQLRGECPDCLVQERTEHATTA